MFRLAKFIYIFLFFHIELKFEFIMPKLVFRLGKITDSFSFYIQYKCIRPKLVKIGELR